MERTKLLALLVSTASVSFFVTVLFVGLPDSTRYARTSATAVLVQTDYTTPPSVAHRPRLIVPTQTVAAAIDADVSSATATGTLRTLASEEAATPLPETQAAAVTKNIVHETATAPSTAVKKVVSVTKKSGEPVPTEFEAAIAAKIHLLTNSERVEQGLLPYSYDQQLAGPAFSYSRSMQTEDFFSHTDPSGCGMTCRFAKTHYSAQAWAENLALWKSTYPPSADEVAEYFVREWKKSAGHRENLFSNVYTHEGIGVSAVGTKILVTVHFAEPS